MHDQGQSGKGACLGTCKISLLHIHLGMNWEFWLTVADYITDSIAHLSHNSVCYNQMYVYIQYLWTLNGAPGCLRLLEATAVHPGCMYLNYRSTCGYTVPTACLGHMLEIGKVFVVIFLAYLWALQGMSKWCLEIQFASFSARPLLVLGCNFLPNRTMEKLKCLLNFQTYKNF